MARKNSITGNVSTRASLENFINTNKLQLNLVTTKETVSTHSNVPMNILFSQYKLRGGRSKCRT